MLTAQENFQLVKLLDKLEWPVTPEVFDALCVNFVTSPIELAVIRRGEKEQEVLMIYREDKFFNGWHIPGSVILPGRTIELVLSALVRREVGIEIHDPFGSNLSSRCSS